MKRRLLSVIAFAVLAATVSSTILYKIISSNSSRTVRAATAPVFVATRDLNAGTLLADADLREVSWPVSGDSPWVGNRSDVIGRVLLTPLAKGEPVAENRLAPKGSGAGMASRIPTGMRAVAVHVDELTGLSRFILPGMHVDVISTGRAGSQGMVSRTLLQNIEVFTTGQSDTKEKSSGPPVFNLLVTPKQAEALSQAVAQSRIELVLRNPLDTSSIVSEAVPAPAPARPRAARAPQPAHLEKTEKKVTNLPPTPPVLPPTVEIIQGTKRTVSQVVAAGPESK
jgi:pilus assembly protein CpaB